MCNNSKIKTPCFERMGGHTWKGSEGRKEMMQLYFNLKYINKKGKCEAVALARELTMKLCCC